MTPEEELLTALFGRKIFIEYDKEDDLAPLLTLSSDKYLDILKAYKDYQPPSIEEQFLKEAFNKDPEKLVTTLIDFPHTNTFLHRRRSLQSLTAGR